MGYADSVIQVVSLSILWTCCAYPLWGFLVGEKNASPMIFGPFIINLISLMSNEFSFESADIDWRVLVFNFSCSGILSFASCLQADQISVWIMVIIGISTLASVGGSLSRIRINNKFVSQIDRRVRLLKVLFIVLPAFGIVWLNSHYSNTNFWFELLIQSMVAMCVIGGSIFTLLFPHGAQSEEPGVGNPLLWIAIRILMAGFIPGFWIWFLYCIVAFAIMQLGRDQVLWPSFGHFWNGIQNAELRSSSITLSLALYQLVLTLQSPLCEVCILAENHESAISHNISRLLGNITGDFSSCSPNLWWRESAIKDFKDYLLASYNVFVKIEDHASCRTHYMYEQTASVLVMVLLLCCSLMYMLRRIKGLEGNQGFWQPVFFISAAVISLLFSRNTEELIAVSRNSLKVSYSSEAIFATGISLFGAIFATFMALFRIRQSRFVRLATDGDLGVIVESNGLVCSSLIPIVIMCLAGGLAIIEYYKGAPGERGYGTTFQLPSRPLGLPAGFDEVELLLAFSTKFDSFKVKTMYPLLFSNCTGIECADSVREFELLNTSINSSCFGNRFITPSSAKTINYIQQPQSFQILLGFADLMSSEMIIVAVLSYLVAILIGASVWMPIFEDMALTLNLATGAVLALAIPFRMSELFQFEVLKSNPEWGIPTICILVVVACAQTFRLRIKRTLSLMVPFRSAEEIEEAFRCSVEPLDAFLERYWPGIDKEKNWNFNELFQKLVIDGANRSNMLPQLELPVYRATNIRGNQVHVAV